MSEERTTANAEELFPTFRALRTRFRASWLRQTGASLWRWTVRRLLPAMLLCIAVYAVAYTAGILYFGPKVKAELRALRASGAPLAPGDAEPPRIPDEENAAPLYMQAKQCLSKPSPRPGGADYFHPVYLKLLRCSSGNDTLGRPLLDDLAELVERDERALEYVRLAAKRAHCRLDLDWDAPHPSLGPARYRFLDVSLYLAARTATSARHGRTEDALESLRLGARLARHVGEEPSEWGASRSHGQRDLLFYTATWSIPTLELTRDAVEPLMTELAHPGHEPSLTVAWDHTGATWLREFQRVGQSGGYSGRSKWLREAGFWKVYPTLLRPWMLADELETLTLLNAGRAELENPFHERATLWVGLRAWDPQYPSVPAWAPMTRFAFVSDGCMVFRPVGYRGYDVASVRLDMLRVAIALECHRQAHGAYPESLEVLTQEGWDVPDDAFSREAFLYERQEGEFRLYSVGPNLRDDGGRTGPWPSKKFVENVLGEQPTEELEGDVVWAYWP